MPESRDPVAEAARFLTLRANEPITLGDMAEHVSYSPFHLCRIFQRRLGVPPGQFLAAARFQRAKRLLLESDENVAEVCFAVGFASVGTFTSRFTAAVGATPREFRRLPHILTSSPPRPVVVSGGSPGGGVVTGSVGLSAAAAAEVGSAAGVYVGLFPRRAARGTPVAGALLGEDREFTLTGLPRGRYWLLASALPTSADAAAQLLPGRTVVGAGSAQVHVTAAEPVHHRHVHLDLAGDCAQPVVVALPALASETAQERRRQRCWGSLR
jgi:AraC-like DNA-binding protein